MDCPARDVLLRLHAGEAIDAELRAHVEGCPGCAQTLMQLSFAADNATPQVGPQVSAPAPRLALGTRVGRYVVIGELGSGGMGVVYAAHDPDLDRKVAIKLHEISASPSLHTSAAQARLMSEAQAMARLSHPNVVSVFDVGMLDGQVFVAMELVEGRTLREWLAEKPRSDAEVRPVMLEAARGLRAAHAAGLVHRDFKPDNVLVGKDGRVRVMDFGIAQPVDREDPLAAQGQVEGTPAYLAPELLAGARADALSDQFSFGVTLYEALFGQRPFPGHPARRDPATRWTVQPPSRDVSVSPALRRIALRALAVDPAQRFKDLGEVISALAVDPRLRRRNRLLGAGAVMAVAAMVFGYQWRLSQSTQLCRGFEARPAQLFSPAVRTEIAQAFQATGKSYAADTYARTERLLEAYSHGWAEARTEACEATRVRGEQPEEVLSLRMVCLDRRLNEWSALLELLRHADGPLVQQAVKASLSLSPLSDCADIAALRAPVPLPRDPAILARVEALREPLSRAKTLLDAGRFQQVEERVAALLPELTAVGYAPLLAEALFYRGTAQSRRADAAASDTLREAFRQAVAARDDARTVQVITQLVRELWERGHHPVAEEWGRIGLALSVRAENPWRLRASLLQQIAGLHWRRGEMEQAGELLDRAWDEVKGQGERDPALRGALLSARALVLDQLGEPERALETHAEAAELQTRLFGAEHPGPLSVQMNRSIALVGAGRLAEAIAVSEQNLAAMRKTLGAKDQNTLGQMLALAEARLLSGEIAPALALAEEATRDHVAVLGAEHPRTAVSYTFLGDTLVAAGQRGRALGLYKDALRILDDKIGQHGFVTLITLNGLGRALLQEGRAREALPIFERALQIADSQKIHRVDLSVAKLGVARSLAATRGDRTRAQRLASEAEPHLARTARAALAAEARELLAANEG